MKSFLIIVILLWTGGNTLVRAQQIYIQRYTIEDGLVNNDILSIYQDSRGFLWICTRGGLSRYDGSRFVNFTTSNGLTNDMINDIVEIAPQEFIIAQNSMGPRLLKNDRISPLPIKSDITINRFYALGPGKLVAAADNYGVLRWDNGRLTRLDTTNTRSITRISVLNDSVYLATDVNLASQLTSRSFKPKSLALPDGITIVLADSKGRIWQGTANGLRLVNPASLTRGPVSYLPLPKAFDSPILRESFIIDMMEDSRGDTWFCTVNGLIRVDTKGITHVYTQRDGLPVSFVNCIREDAQHNIWVGTQMGLAKLAMNNEVSFYNLELGFTFENLFIWKMPGKEELRIFHGQNTSGLNLVSGKVSTIDTMAAPGTYIYKLGNNELLVAGNAKAAYYHAGNPEPEWIEWPRRHFAALVKLDEKNFLAARYDSLFIINGGSWKLLCKVGSTTSINHLAIEENEFLWAGTWNEGLLKFRITREQGSVQLALADTIRGRLPDPNIRALYIDRKNEVWAGTRYQGLLRILEKKDGAHEIQHYGTRQGLASDFAMTITRDSAGNIWLGSSQGVDKLIASGDRYRIFNFGKLNKIFSKVFDIRFVDGNNLLITAQRSLIYTRDLQQDKIPPQPVFITKVSAAPADSLPASLSSGIHLPYDKAQVYFEFSAAQFINENFTKYSYRLLGSNDSAWNISGKSRTVYFANLRPGKYAFQVRALGLNDEWGQPAAYHFFVQSPFWQKAWFIALVVLAAGLLVYALYRYRLQQLIRLERVRNRIATDLHDEIGSNLTNISILSNLSKKNLLQPQKAGDFLERISEEVSSSSQALDDIIWSVNAGHDTLAETVARMRRYAAELFDSANISYELDLDPAFEERRLDMEQRRDIYLLYKEAVNNISKHAMAHHVSMRIAIERQHLLLQVEDDGIGFDPLRETSRHGLKGMQQRVEKWEGTMQVSSGRGKGTRITIRLPVSR